MRENHRVTQVDPISLHENVGWWAKLSANVIPIGRQGIEQFVIQSQQILVTACTGASEARRRVVRKQLAEVRIIQNY